MTKLSETQRYLLEEHVEEYRDGLIGRRELLRRVPSSQRARPRRPSSSRRAT